MKVHILNKKIIRHNELVEFNEILHIDGELNALSEFKREKKKRNRHLNYFTVIIN